MKDLFVNELSKSRYTKVGKVAPLGGYEEIIRLQKGSYNGSFLRNFVGGDTLKKFWKPLKTLTRPFKFKESMSSKIKKLTKVLFKLTFLLAT